MLEVFRQQPCATGRERCLDDEAIPKGDLESLRHFDRLENHRHIDLYGWKFSEAFQCQENLSLGEPLGEFLGDCDVELLQDLGTDDQTVVVSMLQHSPRSPLLLGSVRIVEINQDVGIEESPTAHEARLSSTCGRHFRSSLSTRDRASS